MWQPGSNEPNGVDWGLAAQQWLQYKETYEQWLQTQYQQHLQMVATAHAAAVSSIDPEVINNPPPPPPDKNGDGTSQKKSILKTRYSNSALLKAAAVAVVNSADGSPTTDPSNSSKPKPLFAAYDQSKVNTYFFKIKVKI